MVLAVHGDELYGLAQNLQGVVELDALANGDVGIHRAVQQEEGRLDFVRVEQGAVLGEELGVAPRIAFGSGHGIVRIAPIALAPIAGHVADAGVRGGCGKEVGLGLEIHRHEAAIGSPQATDALGIHKRMGLAELLRTFDDFVGRPVTPGIDVAGGELLPVTDGAAGVDDIDHIVARGEELGAVRIHHAACGGRRAAVVVDNQRILLLRVERGGQAYHTLDDGAILGGEVPRLHLAQLDFVQPFLHRVGQQGGLAFLAVVQIGHTGAGGSSAHIGHQCGIVIGHGEVVDDILLQIQHHERVLLGVVAVDVLAILVGGVEVDAAIGTVPGAIDNGRIEVAGDGRHFLGSQVHQESLHVEVVGNGQVATILADAPEGRGTARQEQLRAVGRIGSAVDVSVPFHQGVGLQRGQVELENGGQGEGALRDVGLMGRAEQLGAVGRNVVQIHAVAAVVQTLGQARGQVILHQIIAVARTGYAVVGMQQALQGTVDLLPFGGFRVDQVVLVGRPREIALGNVAAHHGLLSRGGVVDEKVIAFATGHGVIEAAAFGHPTHALVDIGQEDAACLYLRQLGVGARTLQVIVVTVAGQKILPVRREGNGSDTATEVRVEQGKATLQVRGNAAIHFGELLVLLPFALQDGLCLVLGSGEQLDGHFIIGLRLQAEVNHYGLHLSETVLSRSLGPPGLSVYKDLEAGGRCYFQLAFHKTLGPHMGGEHIEPIVGFRLVHRDISGSIGRNADGILDIQGDVGLQQLGSTKLLTFLIDAIALQRHPHRESRSYFKFRYFLL